MSARKPPYAGLRHWYPNVLTGGHVGVFDGREQTSIETDDRWQVVCEDHGSILSSVTLDLARHDGRHPEEWCEDCMALDSCESGVVVYVIPIPKEATS